MKSRKAQSGMGFGKVAGMLLILICLIVLAVILTRQFWSSGKAIDNLQACNNDMQKCACLLFPEQGASAECPAGSIQESYSKHCPKTCDEEDFAQQLEAARDRFDDSNSERDSFGHCCRGDWTDWE